MPLVICTVLIEVPQAAAWIGRFRVGREQESMQSIFPTTGILTGADSLMLVASEGP